MNTQKEVLQEQERVPVMVKAQIFIFGKPYRVIRTINILPTNLKANDLGDDLYKYNKKKSSMFHVPGESIPIYEVMELQ